MNKNRTAPLLNISGIFAALLVIGLSVWARTGLPSYNSLVNYLSLFGLVSTLLVLPDFLSHYLRIGNKWCRTSEIYTLAILLLLAVFGIVLPGFSAGMAIAIIPAGTALAAWQVYMFLREKYFIALPAAVLFMIMMVLLFYSQGHHSMLFPERIILGKAHIDTLYHSSMSNMFATLGYPSTGLNGSPYIPYHWGFHALSSGLKNWTGLNTVMFVNVAYPAIFMPLFFKSFFGFINNLFLYKGNRMMNMLFALSAMAFLYSLHIAAFDKASPMISEGFTLAFIFTFFYGSILISYLSHPAIRKGPFLFFSLVILLLVSFFKISNGFVLYIGLAYLYLRGNPGGRSLLTVVISGMIVALFVYLTVFQENYVAREVSFMGRVNEFWDLADSFITYLTGAFLATAVILKKRSLSTRADFKSLFRSKEFIDMEMLIVITVASLAAGIYASRHSPDVYYFCIIQFFISIAFLVFYTQNYFDSFRSGNRMKNLFLYFVVLFSFVSVPRIMVSIFEMREIRKDMNNLNLQEKLMQSFLNEMFKLDRENGRAKKCIYIPGTEKWYYQLQTYRPFGSALVAPAASGVAMIAGVPDTVFKMGLNGHGYSFYKKERQNMARNLEEAKKIARSKGYVEMIAYHEEEGILQKQTYSLLPFIDY